MIYDIVLERRFNPHINTRHAVDEQDHHPQKKKIDKGDPY
jgi:hypothetical protein